VGYDDNRDLNLEGAKSALPIWTEFMMKATTLYPPRDPDATAFSAPDGIKFLKVDPTTFSLANSSCPMTYEEAFLEDVVPDVHCSVHGSSVSELLERGTGTVAGGIEGAVKGIGKLFGRIIPR
jgi:penicillin-binding protein 1B